MNGTTDNPRLIIPALGCVYAALGPLSYAGARVVLGGVIMVHGYAKLFNGVSVVVGDKILGPMGFPMPEAWGYFLGILEFFGCALFAVGLLTRPLALMLTVELFIAVFGVHMKNGFGVGVGGFEYPLILAVFFGIYAANGGGRYSIDRLLGKEF
jgi:putative oxidoreductase